MNRYVIPTRPGSLTALESTASWRSDGAHLQLFDGDGAALARFESRNL